MTSRTGRLLTVFPVLLLLSCQSPPRVELQVLSSAPEQVTGDSVLLGLPALAGEEDPWAPSGDLWNGRLLFHSQGGVGIGHSQGRMDNSRARHAGALSPGYAVVYSTGTRTDSRMPGNGSVWRRSFHREYVPTRSPARGAPGAESGAATQAAVPVLETGRQSR